MQSSVRSFVGFALFVGATVPFALPKGAAPRLPGTRAIAEISNESITTVLVTTNTPVQGTRPRLLNRGTQLDGMLRAAPTERMQIHANPFEDAWRAPAIGGINLASGAYSVQEVDIALPAAPFLERLAVASSVLPKTSRGGGHPAGQGAGRPAAPSPAQTIGSLATACKAATISPPIGNQQNYFRRGAAMGTIGLFLHEGSVRRLVPFARAGASGRLRAFTMGALDANRYTPGQLS